MQHWANKKKSSLCLVSVQSTSFLWYHYHDSWIPGSLLSFNILFNIMKCGRYQIAESNLPFRPWLLLNFTICAMTWKRAEGTFLEYISSTCWFLLAPRLSFHKLHQRVLLLMSIFSFLSSTNFSINYDACYCYILLKPSSQSVMSKIMYYFKFNTAVFHVSLLNIPSPPSIFLSWTKWKTWQKSNSETFYQKANKGNIYKTVYLKHKSLPKKIESLYFRNCMWCHIHLSLTRSPDVYEMFMESLLTSRYYKMN